MGSLVKVQFHIQKEKEYNKLQEKYPKELQINNRNLIMSLLNYMVKKGLRCIVFAKSITKN